MSAHQILEIDSVDTELEGSKLQLRMRIRLKLMNLRKHYHCNSPLRENHSFGNIHVFRTFGTFDPPSEFQKDSRFAQNYRIFIFFRYFLGI